MTPDRWERVSEVLDEVYEHPPGKWEAVLDEICEADATIAPLDPGQCLGSYRVANTLGPGGTTVVYEAERADDQLEQTVAFRLLRGTPDPEILQRFRTERLCRKALTMRRELLPPTPPHLASSLVRYGWLLVQRGQVREARTKAQEDLSIRTSLLPDDHWQIAAARNALALWDMAEGDSEAAEPPSVLSSRPPASSSPSGLAYPGRSPGPHKALPNLEPSRRRRSLRQLAPPNETGRTPRPPTP